LARTEHAVKFLSMAKASCARCPSPMTAFERRSRRKRTSAWGREEPVALLVSLPQSRRPTCDAVKLTCIDTGNRPRMRTDVRPVQRRPVAGLSQAVIDGMTKFDVLAWQTLRLTFQNCRLLKVIALGREPPPDNSQRDRARRITTHAPWRLRSLRCRRRANTSRSGSVVL